MTSPATPAVLLIAFNRPGSARKVFERIRLARPARLFLACDGPRPHKAGEAELVAQVRALAGEVDWPCEVSTRFLEQNLGCGRGVSSAIDWFLTEAGEGVILEDDCIPTPAFFRFAAVMLERHRHDPRVAVISGTNLTPLVRMPGSHAFGLLPLCWGWATWRRVWDDFRLRPEVVAAHEPWQDHCYSRTVRKLRRAIQRLASGDSHTWDHQLTIQCLRSGQLTVVPAENLVLNIGFSGDGTHFAGGQRPWWAPGRAYDPDGSWADRPEVVADRRMSAHHQLISYGDALWLRRPWLRCRQAIARWLDRRRPALSA